VEQEQSKPNDSWVWGTECSASTREGIRAWSQSNRFVRQYLIDFLATRQARVVHALRCTGTASNKAPRTKLSKPGRQRRLPCNIPTAGRQLNDLHRLRLLRRVIIAVKQLRQDGCWVWKVGVASRQQQRALRQGAGWCKGEAAAEGEQELQQLIGAGCSRSARWLATCIIPLHSIQLAALPPRWAERHLLHTCHSVMICGREGSRAHRGMSFGSRHGP